MEAYIWKPEAKTAMLDNETFDEFKANSCYPQAGVLRI